MRPTSIAIWRDIKNTFRLWRRNSGSTLAAYIALTVAIGATTTIFSVISSLLLSPLPVADSDHVVLVTGVDRAGQPVRLSMPDALDVKKQVQSTATFAFYRLNVGNVADRSRPAMLHVLETDAQVFDVMGVRMAQGRGFRSEANQPGHGCEAVLSWAFWQAQFAGQIVTGRPIRLNEQPCLVDGVLPKGLDLPLAAEVWTAVPFDLKARGNGRMPRSWYGVAHLKSGVSVNAFNGELAAVCKELSREHPTEDSGLAIRAVLLRDSLTHDVKRSLLILFAAVAGILLMACANVANLLLARSHARRREISVRAALGADRRALFQQLITESMLLALAASLSGLLLTLAAVNILRALPSTMLPRPESIVVDWRVMLFALLAAAVTAVLFGSLPALRVSVFSPSSVLSQAGGRNSETQRQQTIRKLLIGVEAALATVLLIGSLLLLRSFNEVMTVNPGFQPDHLLTAYISLPLVRYGRDTMDTVRFAKATLEHLKNVAGIEAATIATSVPVNNNDASGPVQIEGHPESQSNVNAPMVLKTGISPDYRKTLRIPLLAGRDLNEADNREDGSAVLVNATFAKMFFQQESAIGKRVRSNPTLNPEMPWFEIVGVIGDTKQFGLEAVVQPGLYLPLARATSPFPAVMIRTADKPLPHVRDIENAVRRADPEVPVFLESTMEQVEARRMGPRSFNTIMLTAFAGVALLLACGGIFAVIAYSVSQRTSEIGIRMACGAKQSDIVRMIIGQGLLPALLGMCAGILGALIVNSYLASLLYRVKTTDLISYAGTVALLAAACAAAALLPAWRAARVEPWKALRYE